MNEKEAKLSAHTIRVIELFFNAFAAYINITPEDGSITRSDLSRELFPTDQLYIDIKKTIMNANKNNPLIRLLGSKEVKNLKQYKKQLKKNGQSIYSQIIETFSDPSTRTQSPNLSQLLGNIFNAVSSLENFSKVLYSSAIISEIIELLVSLEVEASLLLQDESVSAFISPRILQKLINSVDQKELLLIELINTGLFHNRVLAAIIRNDNEAIRSLLNSGSLEVRDSINQIIELGIRFGRNDIIENVIPIFISYYEEFRSISLYGAIYQAFLNNAGHAIIRGNPQISLSFIRPEVWNFYRFEDQIQLIRLILLRSGESTRDILMGNLANVLDIKFYLKTLDSARSDIEAHKIAQALEPYNELITNDFKKMLVLEPKDETDGYFKLVGLISFLRSFAKSIKVNFIANNFEIIQAFINKVGFDIEAASSRFDYVKDFFSILEKEKLKRAPKEMPIIVPVIETSNFIETPPALIIEQPISLITETDQNYELSDKEESLCNSETKYLEDDNSSYDGSDERSFNLEAQYSYDGSDEHSSNLEVQYSEESDENSDSLEPRDEIMDDSSTGRSADLSIINQAENIEDGGGWIKVGKKAVKKEKTSLIPIINISKKPEQKEQVLSIDHPGDDPKGGEGSYDINFPPLVEKTKAELFTLTFPKNMVLETVDNKEPKITFGNFAPSLSIEIPTALPELIKKTPVIQVVQPQPIVYFYLQSYYTQTLYQTRWLEHKITHKLIYSLMVTNSDFSILNYFIDPGTGKSLHPSGEDYYNLLPSSKYSTMNQLSRVVYNPYTGIITHHIIVPSNNGNMLFQCSIDAGNGQLIEPTIAANNEQASVAVTSQTNDGSNQQSNNGNQRSIGIDQCSNENNSQKTTLISKEPEEKNIILSTTIPFYEQELVISEKEEYNDSMEEIQKRLEKELAMIQYEDLSSYSDSEDKFFETSRNNSKPMKPSEFQQSVNLPFTITSDPLLEGIAVIPASGILADDFFMNFGLLMA